VIAASCLAALCGAAARGGEVHAGCRAAHYSLVALPLRPVAINDDGDVAGRTDDHRAATWSRHGGLRELPLPDGFADSEAVGINRSGHVVGNLHDRSSGRNAAFSYDHRRLTLLAGEHARVYALNDADVMVGSAVVGASGKTDPVIWMRGTLKPVDSCCGGSLTAIGSGGFGVGDLYDDQGHYHAAIWTDKAGLRAIGPPDKFSSAVAVNALGHVVVQAYSQVYLYASGALTLLDLHPKLPNKPLAISDCDVIVGAYGPYSDADRAFIWDRAAGFLDLNAVLAPDSGWKLEYATGINGHGVIVGRGDFKGEDNAGFMLVPER
jgi:uncharacterized membrane protein